MNSARMRWRRRSSATSSRTSQTPRIGERRARTTSVPPGLPFEAARAPHRWALAAAVTEGHLVAGPAGLASALRDRLDAMVAERLDRRPAEHRSRHPGAGTRGPRCWRPRRAGRRSGGRSRRRRGRRGRRGPGAAARARTPPPRRGGAIAAADRAGPRRVARPPRPRRAFASASRSDSSIASIVRPRDQATPSATARAIAWSATNAMTSQSIGGDRRTCGVCRRSTERLP